MKFQLIEKFHDDKSEVRRRHIDRGDVVYFIAVSAHEWFSHICIGNKLSKYQVKSRNLRCISLVKIVVLSL